MMSVGFYTREDGDQRLFATVIAYAGKYRECCKKSSSSNMNDTCIILNLYRYSNKEANAFVSLVIASGIPRIRSAGLHASNDANSANSVE
jgi:hypothetical protein